MSYEDAPVRLPLLEDMAVEFVFEQDRGGQLFDGLGRGVEHLNPRVAHHAFGGGDLVAALLGAGVLRMRRSWRMA
jgi:hypothetical protein